jgi:hypothetical protein
MRVQCVRETLICLQLAKKEEFFPDESNYLSLCSKKRMSRSEKDVRHKELYILLHSVLLLFQRIWLMIFSGIKSSKSFVVHV